MLERNMLKNTGHLRSVHDNNVTDPACLQPCAGNQRALWRSFARRLNSQGVQPGQDLVLSKKSHDVREMRPAHIAQ